MLLHSLFIIYLLFITFYIDNESSWRPVWCQHASLSWVINERTKLILWLFQVLRKNALPLWQVEEARKKMFNGTISSVPQTFTVVTPQLNSQSSTNLSAPTAASKPMQPGASVLQSLPCQLLGQTSLVLTPVANGSTVTCAPLALTVTNQVQNVWADWWTQIYIQPWADKTVY